MKVDIVSACNKLYGKKNKEWWPGNLRTNLKEYGNACFGSVARLYNFESNSQVLSTPKGQACQLAMKKQLELNGKHPCANWLSVPLIDLPPQISFFNRIKKKNLTYNQVYNIYKQCINECKTDKCKKNVDLDYLAWKLSNSQQIQKPKPKLKSKSPSPFTTPPPNVGQTVPIYPNTNGCDRCMSSAYIYLIVGFALILIILIVSYAKYPPKFL